MNWAGNYNGKIKIWNYQSGLLIKAFDGYNQYINQIVTIKNNLIISCSDDKKIKIWNVETTKCLKTFIEHTHSVLAILSITDNYLLSAGFD